MTLERAPDLLEQSPGLARRAEQHGLWVLKGGKGLNLIAGDPDRVPSEPRSFDRSAGGRGLATCRLVPAACRAQLAGE